MMVEGIFFDIGWTLMRPRNAWMLTDMFYERIPMAERFTQQLHQSMDTAMTVLHRNHRMDTLEQEEQQFRAFYCQLLQGVPELCVADHIIDEIAHDKVFNFRNYIFFEDAAPVLSELSRHYRLGVISDTWPSAIHFLKEAGLYDLFDSFTFSFQLGVFKPDRRMYRHALETLNVAPERAVFVDDSAECLAGAAKEGIMPVQIMQKPDNQALIGCQQIKSLSELLNMYL